MKLKLFFILFFVSTAVCFGQSRKEENKSNMEDLFSTWEKLGYNPTKTKRVDSVYSFLQQVDFSHIIPYGKQKIAVIEKPMSAEYFNGKGFMSFVREMSGSYPVFGERSTVEIFYGMTDTVLLDKPLDYFAVSRINRDYIGVADRGAYYGFVTLYANDNLKNEADKNLSKYHYKNKKQQQIFYHGLEIAQKRLYERVSIVEISIPYFDSSYENAVLVLYTDEIYDSLFYLMFKRDDKGKWRFEGCHSSKAGFSTEVGHYPSGADKFYKKRF